MREQQHWTGPSRVPLPPLINGTPIPLETLLLHDIRNEIRILSHHIVTEPTRKRRSLQQITDFLQALIYLILLTAGAGLFIWDPALFRDLALRLMMK